MSRVIKIKNGCTNLKLAMENQQSLQQPSSQSNNSKPTSLRRSVQAQSTGSNAILRLIGQQPWLVWSGVSVFLLATTAIAITSLIRAEGGKYEELEPNPVATEIAETSPQTSHIPLWLVGAVALSCGAGSLMILKLLNRPSSPPQLRDLNRHSSVQTSKQAASLPNRQRRRRLARSGQSVSVAARSLSTMAPIPLSTEPVVTVLPPEKSRLERSEADLAEMMDLRKQQPLSSILRNF